MHCPNDQHEMVEHGAGPLQVESCSECKGLWISHTSLIAFKSLDRLVEDPDFRESLFAVNRLPDGSSIERSSGPLQCPSCPVELEQRETGTAAIDVCLRCGGMWLEASELDGFLGPYNPKTDSPDESGTAGDALEEPAERYDRFSFDNPFGHRFALPSAFVIALVINATPFVVLLVPLHVWTHEFGHATIAWLSGRRALPLPFGWTSVQFERSTIVYLALAFLLVVWLHSAWRERLRWSMGIAGGLLLSQFYMTWMVSPFSIELWITFGGIGGEFYLSAFLIAAFYFRMPDRWRWDFWRYPVLVVAASTFWENFVLWHRIRAGEAQIPWGSILGEGDAGGDMNILAFQYGWGSERIIDTYNRLGEFCLVVMIGIYVAFLLRNRVRDGRHDQGQ